MAKLYYGDENNTAVEINVGVSQEYVDSQIEAVSADVHSIPAGGTAGQVLAKVDGTDYNVEWTEQNNSELQYYEETITRNGSTVYATLKPKASANVNAWKIQNGSGSVAISGTNYGTGVSINGTFSCDNVYGKNGRLSLQSEMSGDSTGVFLNNNNIRVDLNHATPTVNQVLAAADTDGNLKWMDVAGGSDYEEVESDDGTIMIIRVGKLRIAFNTSYIDFRVEMTNGEGFLTSPVTIGQVPYEDRPTLGGAIPHADYSTTDIDNESYKIMNFTTDSHGTITAYSYVKGPTTSSAISFSYPPYNVIGVWKVE